MSRMLVLGGTSDIGLAIARRFARAGHDIVLAGRNLPRLETAAKDLAIRYEVRAEALAFDALETDRHAEFVAQLDPLPDAAACVFGYMGETSEAETNWAEARRVLDTNFTGAVSILDRLAEGMEARRSGSLIGISSVAGDRGRQSNAHYGAAKAGFSAYLAGLRNRLYSAGVHVMTVKPGYVRTAMTEGMDLPGAITAEPEQVADAVFRGFLRKRNTIYTRWMWRWIMLIVRCIPEPLFKRLHL